MTDVILIDPTILFNINKLYFKRHNGRYLAMGRVDRRWVDRLVRLWW